MKKDTAPQFHLDCWELIKKIPAGRVTTYKEIALALDSKAYRAVGVAMSKNPYAPKVPCHRVVGSDGTLTGYAGGLSKKTNLLKEEGVQVKNGKVENFSDKFFSLNQRSRKASVRKAK